MIEGGQAPAPLRTCVVIVSETFSKTPAPTQERIDSFLDALHRTGDRAVLLSTVPHYCEHYKDPVAPLTMPKSLRIVRNPTCDPMSKEELREHCETLWERVEVTEEAAKKIERETREQQNSPAWYVSLCR